MEKGIKDLSIHLKEKVLKTENNFEDLEEELKNVVNNNYKKLLEINIKINASQSEVLIKKTVQLVREFLIKAISLKYLPFQVYLEIRRFLPENINKSFVYDSIVNNDLDKLSKEIYDKEEIVIKETLDRAVIFISKGYLCLSLKVESGYFKLAKVEDTIENTKNIYCRKKGFVSFKIKIENDKILYEGVPLYLRKID